MKNYTFSKKQSLLFVILFIGLITSCSRGIDVSPLSSPKNQKETQLIIEDEIAKEALNLYSTLFGENLRTEKAPEILSIERTTPFRSTQETTNGEGIYIVNFKNNRGYIILSENKKNEPIICACEQGNFNPSEEIRNPNLIPVLSNTATILEHNASPSSIDSRPYPDTTKDYTYAYSQWKVVEEAGPLVQVHWHQGAPFNNKIDKIDGQLPPVGCVAVAVSQIMSFHGQPDYDWSRIIEQTNNPYYIIDPYTIEVLSTLHKDLGKAENLNMSYGLEGSGADSGNVPRTFRNYGYQCGDLISYDWDTIKKEITAGRPVFVRANAFKHTTKTPGFLFWGDKTKVSYSGGHAWVLDGYRRISRSVAKINVHTRELERSFNEYRVLVHCNFGWGGTGDGYYLNKAFDTNKGPEMRATSESVSTSGEDYNFQYNHQIIKGIQR